ncbi:MAG: DUF4339 domain-containing protein [Sandaracinaceae bacterium]|nr:DUF4339 domain-containing protein [Sandaracinaceae bacterium]
MTNVWYYEQHGESTGPVPLETLLSAARAGHLGEQTRVWKAGMPSWTTWTSLPELAAAAGPPPLHPLPPPLEPLRADRACVFGTAANRREQRP